MLGNLIGGLIARSYGILAPYWVGFVVTGLFLALIWRQLKLIVHADEEALSRGVNGSMGACPPISPS